MAPLKEKSSNASIIQGSKEFHADAEKKMKERSVNTGRKRKSDVVVDDDDDNNNKENTDAPNKKAKKQTSTTTTKTSKVKDENDKDNDNDKKKKAKASSSSSSGTKKAPSKKAQNEADLAKYDVSSISLDGESRNAVPVYDTCADIRTKINAHLRNAPTKLKSQAAFIREIRKSINTSDGEDDNTGSVEGLSTRGLTTFLKKKGPCGGASSPIFYASYVYFEKLRVKQDKKKSQKREEMEREWGKKGMDFHDSDQRMFVHRDEHVEITKYGRMNFHRMR